MNTIPEVAERELTYDELGARYRAICDDLRFENLPGKVELDTWGRMIMSPASNYHGILQGRLTRRFSLTLEGEVITEASVLTSLGLQVADVAWASVAFMQAHGAETPFTRAPELCVEVASPSDSRKGLREKSTACIAAGAREAWIVFPQSKRIEFYAHEGPIEQTRFAIDLAGLFGV
jgi:Uma2 family endonuclease